MNLLICTRIQAHKKHGSTIVVYIKKSFLVATLPETNIAPENGWLEY